MRCKGRRENQSAFSAKIESLARRQPAPATLVGQWTRPLVGRSSRPVAPCARSRRRLADQAFGTPRALMDPREARRRSGPGWSHWSRSSRRFCCCCRRSRSSRPRARALVSVAAYSLLWGWQFAVGFVVLIFIHEMGHVVALRRDGIKASAPMFMPFMGAVIGARSLGDDALDRGARRPRRAAARLARRRRRSRSSAWPTHSDFLEALGYIGLLLNLFNLLPVVPLDGGRAMAAMAPWMWFLGFGALVALDVHHAEPDPPDHLRRRRLRALPPLAAAPLADGRADCLLPRLAAQPAARRRGLRRADRAARAGHALTYLHRTIS